MTLAGRQNLVHPSGGRREHPVIPLPCNPTVVQGRPVGSLHAVLHVHGQSLLLSQETSLALPHRSCIQSERCKCRDGF